MVAIGALAIAATPAAALPDFDGDGVVAGDCSPLDPAVHPGAADKPDLAFEDTNCDGIDGDAARAVFVAVSGNNAATGTKENPKQTIGAGITTASAADPKKDVYVAGGNYSEVVSVADGVGIYGGYAPVTGARSESEVTTITGAPQAVLADDDQGVVLQLVTLNGNPDFNRSAYGLRAINGSTVALSKVNVSAANGTVGPSGASPSTPGKPLFADGQPGGCPTPGSDLGFGAAGQNGGNGGAGGTNGSDPGDSGSSGVGNSFSGGGGGAAGGGEGDDGDPGSKPSKTADGSIPPFSLAFAAATWTAPAATAGSPGLPGQGGGGGGGGGGVTIPFLGSFAGAGGGEGGGGGAGGSAGGAGQNGGASFAAYVFNSSVVASNSTLAGGTGGKGGNGGNGATGGPGGVGAPGGLVCFFAGAGGSGGNGGDGGNAGHGGGGTGGPSAGVFATGAGASYADRGSTEQAASGGAGGNRGGGGPAAAAGQSSPVLKAPSAPANPAADFDGDGIVDANDACPETARGSDADADGCPDRPAKLGDQDGDLIPDSADACAGTPRGNDLNEDGCPDAAPTAGLDNDRDGFFAGQDCDDNNSAIRPGAQEVRGNLIDENCDGRADDFRRITSGVSTQWAVRGAKVTIKTLLVKAVPAGATVEFRCTGKRCPVKRTKGGKPRRGQVNLLAKIKKVKSRFRAGQTVEVRITAPSQIGKVVRFKLVKGKVPTGKSLCLRPGAKKPRRC